ncbi:XRE family transcriptional regulator [Ktedonosporobacter rubrisoli]|uniref:XRE family transcriptional regulator n=1 Tax=Ktedonosporobacter rubrisoli TaxID=2509675 RepID=A0A4P6JJN8_KTERU|nr:helix-turn-helix transcriptional regulator [Ktedonosporobacter rubrisoli]QBD75150.1 XRE family transcriptional regulator [Ktedonosporobacter rubrisoli]
MVKHNDSDEDRRKELADFLRTRRESLRPEKIGLPMRPRRRTPGLRREDIAELLRISATWYTWLEQGRPIQVSREVIENLAHVLRLNTDERVHLFQLARQPLPPQSPLLSRTLKPYFQAMLAALEPSPAHIRDAIGMCWPGIEPKRFLMIGETILLKSATLFGITLRIRVFVA